MLMASARGDIPGAGPRGTGPMEILLYTQWWFVLLVPERLTCWKPINHEY